MAHSYVSQLMHCVFSTKERRPFITPELQPRLFAYIGGIAKKNKMKLIAAGGIEDHVHLLILLSKMLDIAKAMQLIKGGSSSGFMRNSPSIKCSNGRKVTAHFRSGLAKSRGQSNTLTIRPSITRERISKLNSFRFWTNILSNTMSDTFSIDLFVQSSLRDFAPLIYHSHR